MSDLISRKALLKDFGLDEDTPDVAKILIAVKLKDIENKINNQPTAYDVDKELRLLKNYIDNMPKTYRKRNVNWVIVRDLLMAGTPHAGRTSSIKKCFELGIDAYDYNLIVKGCKQDD